MRFFIRSLFVVITLFLFSITVFTKTTFELGVNLSGGVSATFKSFVFDTAQISREDINKIKEQTFSDVGFEFSGNLIIGANFDIKTNISMGAFFDIGYGNDFFGFIQKNSKVNNY